MPSVGVIVCTYNRPDHLLECVESILANDYAGFELLVMDQSTDHSTSGALQALGDSRVRYFKLDRPGKSRAMNLGVSQSSADILCFTDDDCLASESWIRNVVAEFERDASLSAVYGQTLPEFLGNERLEYATFSHPIRQVYQGRRSPYRVGGAGGNMAYRRSAILALGRFDENLGPGARFKAVEDNEYFYRTFRGGFKAVYSPSVVVCHKQLWTEESRMARHSDYRFGDGAFIAKYLLQGDWHPLYYYLKLEIGRLAGALFRRQFGYSKFVVKSILLTSRGIAAYARWHREFGSPPPDQAEHPDPYVSSRLQ